LNGPILLLMRSVVVLGAVVFAMPLLAQGVSAVNGNIVFADNRGGTKQITAGHSDSDPRLSFDGRQLVFVRHTANDKGFEADWTELWIAHVDGTKAARRVLVGHDGASPPGPTMLLAEFSKPQFSPNGQRVYFMSAAWATSAAIDVLDLRTGKVIFLFAGVDVDVIQHGRYSGFLLGTTVPLTKQGRIFVYRLLDADGRRVRRMSETDFMKFRKLATTR